MPKLIRVVALLWLLVVSTGTTPRTFSGKVVKVIDGDTIDVLVGRETQRVRFFGIDAPERAQAYYTEARKHLADWVAGQPVKVIIRDTDRYGRIVGDVYLKDAHINLRLVREGWAWHYTHYSDNPALQAAEKAARRDRRGLWQQSNPTPPWTYRQQHKRDR